MSTSGRHAETMLEKGSLEKAEIGLKHSHALPHTDLNKQNAPLAVISRLQQDAAICCTYRHTGPFLHRPA